MPASRMEIEESRRVREERREVTDALSDAADEVWDVISAVGGVCDSQIGEGWLLTSWRDAFPAAGAVCHVMTLW